MFYTIKQEKIEEEITEKKSKFIATMCYVKSEEEAQNVVKELKKQYFDARHNCFAYRVIEEGKIIERFSDDGEPSGTAGMPMLNILAKNNICNVIVVVTRYFGGILLGTGGLVRAYSEATQKALKTAELVSEVWGLEAEIEVSYNNLEMLKYYCKKNDISIIDLIYENNVKAIIEVTKEEYEKIIENKVADFYSCEIKIEKNIKK